MRKVAPLFVYLASTQGLLLSPRAYSTQIGESGAKICILAVVVFLATTVVTAQREMAAKASAEFFPIPI